MDGHIVLGRPKPNFLAPMGHHIFLQMMLRKRDLNNERILFSNNWCFICYHNIANTGYSVETGLSHLNLEVWITEIALTVIISPRRWPQGLQNLSTFSQGSTLSTFNSSPSSPRVNNKPLTYPTLLWSRFLLFYSYLVYFTVLLYARRIGFRQKIKMITCISNLIDCIQAP